MSEKDIASNMILFIEEKERKLQTDKMTAEQVKSDIVKAILDELERMMTDENK